MEATILIPTHDHADTLLHSVPSALSQSVQDIEVFVVGDGAPDRTRELMAELCRADPRVRYFDFPKGPRHGELHRHEVLKEARGRCVCYHCDDDLWLPGHLDALCEALRWSDFAHTVEILVPPEGVPLLVNGFDMGHPADRKRSAVSDWGVGLSCVGHTLAAYRGLPYGWRTTPPGTLTDLHMWRQFLSQPGICAVSVMEPGVLKFPAPMRRQSPSARAAELAPWSERARSPEFAKGIRKELHAALLRRAGEITQPTRWVSISWGEPYRPYRIGDRIDFSSAGNAEPYLSWGWWFAEEWGRWSDGGEARVTMKLDAAPERRLAAEVEVRGMVSGDAPWLDVDVAANGERAAAWAFVNRFEATMQVAPLPESVSRTGLLDLRFQIPHPVAVPGDNRRIGVGVTSLRVVEYRDR
jgi:GalNAc5-diNAcBac-PP-undecaprenol beta-1,3-glucosyltransferase